MKTLALGDKIRGIRTLKGLSQENMSEMLGLSLPAYADIERGKKEVTMKRMEEIAEKLEVSVSDILGFGEKVQNFFENCNSINVNAGTYKGKNKTENNNYGEQELIHKIEVVGLEKQLLQSEIDKLQLKVEKLELELSYLKEKA